MRRRHPALPRLWLMTDERMGDDLLLAIGRLPKGKAGVVLRNYSLAAADRRALFDAARKIARRNRLVLLLGGPERDRKSTTSELQSLMRISYAVFCLKKKTNTNKTK